MLWWYVFYRNNRKWIDIDKLAALFVQVTVGRRNVPKGRVWNPMEQSKWTEVSSIVNYTQIFFTSAGVTRKMSSYGWPGITRGRETTLKFCGVKIYYQLFFSFTHHLVGFLFDWQSQCLEDIMVAQTKMLPIRGRWNDDRRLCTTWSFSAAYMKDCFLWRLFYF